MSKLIEITVDPQGKSTVQTKGFAGSECRQASRFLEQALGKSQGEQLTSEFYQSVSVDASIRQRNGA